MNFKSAEEWYQYIKEQYTSNEEIEVSSLLDKVPAEFIEDKIFNRIKEHAIECAEIQQSYLEQIILINKESFENKYKEPNNIIINYGRNSVIPTVIDNAWDLKGKQSVKNSIFKHHKKTDWEAIDYFQNAWFEEAIDFFNGCKSMTKQNIANSIDTKRLIKNEINNIDTFLDAGKYLSNSFYKGVVTEELYQYYNDKLWGGFAWDFVSINVMLNKWKEISNLENTEEGNKTKSAILAEVLEGQIEKGWWLSVRLQALLWMKEYLEELEKKEINDICSEYGRKNIFDIPSDAKQGFNVLKPKIIPVLHQALIDNQLIESMGLDCFKQAFMNGDGFIVWLKGGNSLIYFTNKMARKYKLITADAYIKKTSEIFMKKNGTPFKYKSLNTANDKNHNMPPTYATIIDSIIARLIA